MNILYHTHNILTKTVNKNLIRKTYNYNLNIDTTLNFLRNLPEIPFMLRKNVQAEDF